MCVCIDIYTVRQREMLIILTFKVRQNSVISWYNRINKQTSLLSFVAECGGDGESGVHGQGLPRGLLSV